MARTPVSKKKKKAGAKSAASETKPLKKKKKHKYLTQKYPALNPKYQVGNRRELLGDIDYIDKLSEKEKRWLNAFLSETVITNFKHSGPKLYKKVEDKRALYRENNKRNIDIYNALKLKNTLAYAGLYKTDSGGDPSKTGGSIFDEYVRNNVADKNDIEDAIIEAIDSMRIKKD